MQEELNTHKDEEYDKLKKFYDGVIDFLYYVEDTYEDVNKAPENIANMYVDTKLMYMKNINTLKQFI